MSLINEALKKAQQQRSGESPPLGGMPAIGGESAARIARRGKPAGFNTLLLRLGAAAVALLVLVGGGVFLLRNKSSEPAAPVKPVVVAAAPAPTPAESAPPPASTRASAPVVAATPSPPPVSAGSLVVPTAVPVKIEPVTAAHVEPPPPAEPVKTVGVPILVAPASPLPEAAAARPAGTAKLDPRAINYIESLHVAGIRASTTDAKVLMNDRVYRIGSIVEREMGLKLTGITANSLTFEDERGVSYTRTF